MVKRCSLCAKKLDDNGKCTNPKCPKCIQEKIISNLKNKEGVDNNDAYATMAGSIFYQIKF